MIYVPARVVFARCRSILWLPPCDLVSVNASALSDASATFSAIFSGIIDGGAQMAYSVPRGGELGQQEAREADGSDAYQAAACGLRRAPGNGAERAAPACWGA